MFNARAVADTQSASRSSRLPLARVALTIASAMGLAIGSTGSAAAQTPAPESKPWELRITSGAFVPAGSQRNALKNAQVSAAQMSWVLRPSLAITGTFAWARSRDLEMATTPKLDVFTSDVGIEVRPVQWGAKGAMSVSPFVGLGGGARSYNYRKLDVDATHNVAGFAAVGSELGMGRVGVRLEVRDYTSGFTPLIGGGASHARNDVVVMGALSLRRHRASAR